MAEIRVFNPSFRVGKGGTVAKHRRHYRRHHSRRNPFGVSSGAVKDAMFNAGGAVASIALSNLLPSYNTGWTGVALTGAAAVASSFLAKMVVGAGEAEEVLKGGLTAAILRAIQVSGIFSTGITISGMRGMGLYQQSMFPIPTSSDAYGRVLPQAAPKAVSGMGRLGGRFASRYM